MRIHILTLFPEMFQSPFDSSIVKRARDTGVVSIEFVNTRDFARDKHRTVDDYPYGGGPGMLMKVGPVFEALESVKKNIPTSPEVRQRVVLLSPQGRPFEQKVAGELSSLTDLTLICGHYEGVDERIREHLVDDEVSIGDYVLTGGELAAMVVVDAVVRLLPSALGNLVSPQVDTFSDGLLQFPQYTRPQEFQSRPDSSSWKVPDVLLSGNHGEVAKWRRRQSLYRTWQRRPDLLAGANLTPAERALIKVWENQRNPQP